MLNDELFQTFSVTSLWLRLPIFPPLPTDDLTRHNHQNGMQINYTERFQ